MKSHGSARPVRKRHIFEMNDADRTKDEIAINGLPEALTKALYDKNALALIALLSDDAVHLISRHHFS
jgi:hypothetical protein